MVLKSRVKAPDWSAGENPDKEAKCRKHPLPTKHDIENDPWFHGDEEEARAICNGVYDGKVCPFREQCLYGALVNNEQSGVFGGFATVQRKWIRKQREAENESDRIYRDDWEFSEEWRARVPELDYFEEEEEDDGEDTED